MRLGQTSVLLLEGLLQRQEMAMAHCGDKDLCRQLYILEADRLDTIGGRLVVCVYRIVPIRLFKYESTTSASFSSFAPEHSEMTDFCLFAFVYEFYSVTDTENKLPRNMSY